MKRLLAAVIIICVLLSLPVTAGAVSISDFYDVSRDEWYYDAVSFVTENGMFNGTGSNSFSPNDTMTRGMFVTVLGRYAGVSETAGSSNLGIITKSDVNMRALPTTSSSAVLAVLQTNETVEVFDLIDDTSTDGFTWYYVRYNGIMGYIRSDLMAAALNSFSDVPDDAYYKPYVLWAASSFVASPTGDGTFSPDRAITREEICSMLYNFALIKNLQLKPVVTAMSFSDGGAVSTNYRDAVSALQRAGIVNGYEDSSFRPGGSATRAEVSAMLMRFLDAISYRPVIEPSIDAWGNYIFGTEVPQGSYADLSYFSDACFIGHSLMVGMKTYSGITNADYYALNGASTSRILSYEDFPLSGTHTDDAGNTVANTGTLEQAMQEKSYGKVYIMLGVNEVGTAAYHQQTYYNNMSSLIDIIRKTQPNARIYLISSTPVSQSCSESREDVNRDNLIAFNTVLKQLCVDYRAYYLNAFDLLANSDGFLPESYGMSDGIHILAPQYALLTDYIRSHTIS